MSHDEDKIAGKRFKPESDCVTEVRTEGCVEDRQGMWVTGLTSIVRGENQPV